MPRLGFNGFDAVAEGLARQAFEQLARSGWALAGPGDSEFLLLDLDSMSGQMAWMKGLPDGVTVIGVTVAAHAHTPFRLRAGFSAAELGRVLAEVWAAPIPPPTTGASPPPAAVEPPPTDPSAARVTALGSGEGRVLGHAPGTRFQLGRWPPVAREFPRHFRIATVMLKAPATVAEIALGSGASAAEVADYINAALAAGHASAH